jgi:hypothetical protein
LERPNPQYTSESSVVGPTARGGASGRSCGSLTIAARKVGFEYGFQVDPTGKKPPDEALTINGERLDLQKGRVVLVDLLIGGAPRWKQVQVDLPQSPSWPTETDRVQSQMNEILKSLRKRSEPVRLFLN